MVERILLGSSPLERAFTSKFIQRSRNLREILDEEAMIIREAQKSLYLF
jgi:hypothetical protein